MEELSGKSALITGGISGIGLATAKLFLDRGFKTVTLLDTNEPEGLRQTQNLTKQYPSAKVVFIKTDVREEIQMKNAFQKANDESGGIDVVVNSAGICDENMWKQVVEVNLIGTIYGTTIGMENMTRNKGKNGGIVVNISSIAGLIPAFVTPVYTATKFAVRGFSKSLANPEFYKQTGVKVIIICPSTTLTSMFNTSTSKGFNQDVSGDAANKFLSMFVPQSPEAVARGIVEAILDGENGAVWLVSTGKARKIHEESDDYENFLLNNL